MTNLIAEYKSTNVFMIDIDMTAIDILNHPESSYLKYHNLPENDDIGKYLMIPKRYGVKLPNNSKYFEDIDYHKLQLDDTFKIWFRHYHHNHGFYPIVITRSPRAFKNYQNKIDAIKKLFNDELNFPDIEIHTTENHELKAEYIINHKELSKLEFKVILDDNPYEIEGFIKKYPYKLHFEYNKKLPWVNHIEEVLAFNEKNSTSTIF